MSTLTSVLCGTLLGLTAVSCADKNFDWEEAKSQNPEYVFRSNFESLVGPIDPNQSWDFSYSGRKAAKTRAEGDDISITELETGITFSSAFRSKVSTTLNEGSDNSSNGTSYVLYAEDGSFDIYPIWHGKCMQWDLYVNRQFVANYKTVMEMMGSNEIYGQADTDEQTIKGWHIEVPSNVPVVIELKITKSDTGRASKNYYADEGSFISPFYNPEKTWTTGLIFTQTHTLKFGSLSLDLSKLGDTKPEELSKIIMFEDSYKQSDKDFNDFVLGIRGKISEIPVEPKDNKIPWTNTISKRYMVEDLGSTAKTDIDFNDLVVDLTHSQDGYYKLNSDGSIDFDSWEADPESTPVQTAQIRAMGGTLDFLFMLTREDGGVTKYKPIYKKSANVTDVKAMVNTYPEDIARGYEILKVGAPFTITGWDPEANNVAFYVSREEISTAVGTEITTIDTENTSTSGDLYNSFATKPFSFPEPGEVPYIIAFDVTKNWRQERQKICSHWLTGTLNGNAECSTCGSNETDYTK